MIRSLARGFDLDPISPQQLIGALSKQSNSLSTASKIGGKALFTLREHHSLKSMRFFNWFSRSRGRATQEGDDGESGNDGGEFSSQADDWEFIATKGVESGRVEEKFLLLQIEKLYDQIDTYLKERTGLFRYTVLGSAAYWAWHYSNLSAVERGFGWVPPLLSMIIFSRVIFLRYGSKEVGMHIARVERVSIRESLRWEEKVADKVWRDGSFVFESLLWLAVVGGNIALACFQPDASSVVPKLPVAP